MKELCLLGFLFVIAPSVSSADDNFTTIETRSEAAVQYFIDQYDPTNSYSLVSEELKAKFGYALACYWKNTGTANADGIIDWIQANKNYPTDGSIESCDGYWSVPMMTRILVDPFARTNMGAHAFSDLRNIVWHWVSSRSKLSDAQADVWNIHMSENHDAIQKSSYYLICEFLATESLPYGPDLQLQDGHTLSEHSEAWRKYWKEYFRQRAREGLQVEVASPHYQHITIASYYNILAGTQDSTLGQLVMDYLTLFWADAAQEFLPSAGVRGGAQIRCYKDKDVIWGNYQRLFNSLYCMNWHNLNYGNNIYEMLINMSYSLYLPPDEVAVLSGPAKGSGIYRTRRWGLGTSTGSEDTLRYTIDFDDSHNSSLLRCSSYSPYYVMGSMSFNPAKEYTTLTKQNRSMGVMFSEHRDSRIIVVGNGTSHEGRTGYAEITGCCEKDCLIVGKDYNATGNDGTKIWIYKDLWDRVETNGGWRFTYTGPSETSAFSYTGIKICNESYSVTNDVEYPSRGKWLLLHDGASPVIIQCAEASNYVDYAAFKTSVLSNSYAYNDNEKKVSYTSENGDAYEFYSDSSSQFPTVNGQTYQNLNPARTYLSSFITGYHGSNRVGIHSPGYDWLYLDFGYYDEPLYDDYQTHALWKMDSISAGLVSDYDPENPGRDRDLSVVGAVIDTNGYHSGSLSFDGSNDYATVVSGWGAKDSVRVELWFKARNGVSATQWLAEVPSAWRVYLSGGSAWLNIFDENGNATTISTEVDTGGEWQHLTASYNKDSHLMYIATLDGEARASGPESMKKSNYDINLGCRKAQSDRFFNGWLDDVKISYDEY